MGKTAKLTVSLPQDLITFADKMAKKRKISRSQVVSECLREQYERRLYEELKEGYLATAKEQKEFADMAIKIALEVVPEWKVKDG